MSKAVTYKRTDEATPNGGVYSIIYYRNGNGHPCTEAYACSCEIVEYDADDQPIARNYGTMKRPGEYPRYLRRQAERFARSKGYDPKRLRYGRKRGQCTFFPILCEEAEEPMAVVIDEAGNAELQKWSE